MSTILNDYANEQNKSQKSKNCDISIELLNFLMVTTTNDKGNSFAYINGYNSITSGQIANHKVNLNFRYGNAQAKDLIAIKKIDLTNEFETFKAYVIKLIKKELTKAIETNETVRIVNHFKKLNNDTSWITYDYMVEGYTKAYNSVVKVGEPSLDGSPKKSSKQRDGQINTYELINNTVKFHKANDLFYIYARTESKEILQDGVFKMKATTKPTFASDYFKRPFKSLKYKLYRLDRNAIVSAYKRKFDTNELQIAY